MKKMLSYSSFVLFRRRNQLTANECRLEMFAILFECGEFRQTETRRNVKLLNVNRMGS